MTANENQIGDTETATPSVPPSPIVGEVKDASAPPTQNPWLATTTTFTINSQRPLPTRRPRGVTTILRSSFRAGELKITDAGIELRGQGAQPLTWLTNLGWAGWIILVLGSRIVSSITRNWAMPVHQRTMLSLTTTVLGLAILYGARVINEQRRVAITGGIPWENVVELQVHPKLAWAVLLYLMPPIRPGGQPRVIYLPISGLQPAMIDALADALDRHIPGRSRSKAILFELMSGISGAVSLFYLVILVGGLIAVLWYLIHH